MIRQRSTRALAAAPLLLVPLLASCYPPPRMTSMWPETRPVATYSLGQTQRTSAGSVMVDRTEGSRLLPGFILDGPLTVQGTRQPPEREGVWAARFEYQGDCPSGRYILTSPHFYGDRIGIVVSEDGSVECPLPVMQLVGAKRGRAWAVAETPSRPFTPAPYIADFEQDAVRWQLLYKGRSGNTLTLDYLEFRGAYDDYAEPTLRQEVRFDLSRGRKITYRDTVIQVLNASSREIEYRVVEDRGQAVPVEIPDYGSDADRRYDERGYDPRAPGQPSYGEQPYPPGRGPRDYRPEQPY